MRQLPLTGERTSVVSGTISCQKKFNARIAWSRATKTIAWMTPFAPVGFNELRAVLRNRATILDLSSDEIEKLASGISSILS